MKPRTRGGGREELSEVRVDDSETETEVRPSQKIEHRRPHVSSRHPETHRGESRYPRSEHERTAQVERNRSPQIQQSRSSARASSKVQNKKEQAYISLQEWKEDMKRIELSIKNKGKFQVILRKNYHTGEVQISLEAVPQNTILENQWKLNTKAKVE